MQRKLSHFSRRKDNIFGEDEGPKEDTWSGEAHLEFILTDTNHG